MRKLTLVSTLITLVAIAVAILGVWSVFGPDPSGAAADEILTYRNFGLGQRIAGTWVSEDFVVNGTEFPDFRVLQSLSADGSFAHDTTGQYALIGGAVRSIESTARGTWRRVGERTLSTVQLSFEFDADGQLEIVYKLTTTMELSDDLASFRGSFASSVLFPGQDFVEDPGFPVASGTFTGRRLEP